MSDVIEAADLSGHTLSGSCGTIVAQVGVFTSSRFPARGPHRRDNDGVTSWGANRLQADKPDEYGLWTFAPFLHNNFLGDYTGDPSVEGRLRAFDDAVEKLLWPERRDGEASIYRTTVASKPRLPGRGWLEVPAGTPVVLVGNLDWTELNKKKLLGRFLGKGFDEMIPHLLEHNLVPDFIQDKGHTYGADLPDADKLALIEYLKYM